MWGAVEGLEGDFSLGVEMIQLTTYLDGYQILVEWLKTPNTVERKTSAVKVKY